MSSGEEIRARLADRIAAGFMGELDRADLWWAVNELDRLTAELALAGAKLLMVGSEASGDPKIDPTDTSDPRWTPTLRDVSVLRGQMLQRRNERDAAIRERDARPAISEEMAIRFLSHETIPGAFRAVIDAVTDFGIAAEARRAHAAGSGEGGS